MVTALEVVMVQDGVVAIEVSTFFSSLLLSSLELSDTTIYEPYMRALLGTDPRFCHAVVLQPRLPAAAVRRLIQARFVPIERVVLSPKLYTLNPSHFIPSLNPPHLNLPA